METPIVRLTELDAKSVYEPAEDSFLLIDSLEADLNMLKMKKPKICVEIGCGSGIIINALALAFKKDLPAFFMAIDINPEACRVTKNTSTTNNTSIEIVQMDLTSSLCSRGLFDVIIFNPPYVVTESIEIFDERLITKTWAGGKNGREVMDRLFPQIPELLSDSGVFYLVVIKENNPVDIIDIFRRLNMSGEIISDRKVRGEHLHVLRFVKVL